MATSIPVSAPKPSSQFSEPGSQGRFLPGTLIQGRYRIISLLGRGGMGEVYRADDLTLGQSVALKFLPEALLDNEDALRRFRNEVRIARQVSHPNVCRVHDVGEFEGQVFLSMEYVDGEDLASLLRRIGRLPEDKALEIARKLCAGLAAAHEKGVLHRDLKPANIMLDARGQVLLTDFGLAGLADQISGAEVRSGTPAYMAPEQLSGKEVTIRSDLYSLGLVLYELFTGKRPFDGNSLAELIDARMRMTPVSVSSMVRDLDPAIESVIMRCLEADPERRPRSAILISAALPGGDPLAAALAAGQTPSPQMVAAAGEGAGLSLRVAIPLFVAVLLGLTAHLWLTGRESGLVKSGVKLSPDVLIQKSRELIRQVGYSAPAADHERGFEWIRSYLDYVHAGDKPVPLWNKIFQDRPPVLRFWYRQSPQLLVGAEFHDDLLTPNVVAEQDPPSIISGMIHVDLDAEGRLLQFRAMPPQKQEPLASATPPDWSVLFAAAELAPANLTPAEPEWAWLESSDVRQAWTGKWPGTSRPIRVEAAAWRGKPVVFAVLGPWSKPERMPAPGSQEEDVRGLVLAIVALVVLAGAALLTRIHLAKGRSDWRGALRLATLMFCVEIALWAARSHFNLSLGTLGMFFIAIGTSVYYGVIVWTVYLALEPYIRRYWPQTIISWTRVLSGRISDPIVGRDVLIGAAVSLCWRAIGHASFFSRGPGAVPSLVSTDLLLGLRSSIGEYLEVVPHAIRETLVVFFLLFLLRVVLRNQWLGALAFAIIFTAMAAYNAGIFQLLATFAIYASIATVILRFGLLALASAIFIDGIIGDVPVTSDPSVWYFGIFACVTISVIAFLTWAFRESIAGQKLFPEDLLG